MAETEPQVNPTEETPTNTEQTASGDATEEVHNTSVAAEASEKVNAATSAVKDNVFSMFGGGPKKEKKADQDEGAEELFGGSKPQKKEEDVSTTSRTSFA